VAEFSIDFRVKAAASGWNESSLKSAYFHTLDDSIKDELATLDEPTTVEELMKLTIRLDKRLRARPKSRSRGHVFSVSAPAAKTNDVSSSSVPSEVESRSKNRFLPVSVLVTKTHYFSPPTVPSEVSLCRSVTQGSHPKRGKGGLKRTYVCTVENLDTLFQPALLR